MKPSRVSLNTLAVLAILALVVAGCGRQTATPRARPTPTSTPTPTRTATPATRAANGTASGTAAASASTSGAATAPPAPAPAPSPTAPTPTDVVTYRGDYARTGWYQNDPWLTTAVLPKIGALWQSSLLAGTIYAQPLVDAADHLILTVTTANDAYGLNAANGHPVWGPVNVGTPVPRSMLACGDVNPVGMLSTPVLDPATDTLYAVALTRDSSAAAGMRYELVAISAATGVLRPGFPVPIPDPPGFNIRYQQQRAALTLLHNTIYIAFGGYYGDCGPYHGWVIGVPLAHPAAQQSLMVPTAREGAIWAAAGMATGPNGSLYAATGNGSSTSAFDYGDSVLRLHTQPTLGFSRNPRDFFAPSNFAMLNANDADLGSDAPVVLPPQPGTTTPDLLFATGKPGVGYLINRANLGGVGTGNGVTGQGVYSACLFGPCPQQHEGSFATAAYWPGGPAGNFIFAAGDGLQPPPCQGRGGVVALRLGVQSSGASDFSVAWCSQGMLDPGSPAVTGPAGGNAVLWVIDTRSGVLLGLDALTGNTLWSAPLGPTERFIAPAISGEHLYIGGQHRVTCFGPVD